VKIAVVLGQFPKLSERFLARELAALLRHDLDIRILALTPGPAEVFEEEPFASLRERTTVVAHWMSLGGVIAKVSQPLGTLKTLRVVPDLAASLPADPRRSLTIWPRLNWGPVVAREVRRSGCELIWAHWATIPGAVGMVASRMTGLPFALSCHAWDVFVNRALVAAQLRSARLVTACSRAALEHLRELYGPAAEGIELIHHGVELERAPPEPPSPRQEGPFRVLGVGRLVAKKGFEHLLAATARGDFEVELIGDGPLREHLGTIAAELGLTDRVHFDGLQDAEGMERLFKRCGAICAPSVIAPDGDRDGVPNVLLEASLAGLPVITTDAGGLGDFIEHERTGLLVPPRDPAAIAAAVERLRREEGLAARLIVGAWERIRESFNLERNAARLAELLRAAAGPPGQAGFSA
jgi:glycosyltransferase involved in cell wall biosynthesis